MGPPAAASVSTGYQRHVALHDGERVLLRPLTPEDAALYPDFLTEVTSDKLVHYDSAVAMAFIAIEEATGRMLGVVRLHDDPAGGGAEFAILLRSHLKGHGLGWLMMKHMIAYAKQKGLKTVHGEVLAENATMLKMCGELGFHSSEAPGERGIKQVRLPLDEVSDAAIG
jgi:GNAT superfamily N-acetyltransferase